MKNNQVMLVVVFVLVVIVAMMVYDRTQEPQTPGEAISSGVERVADDFEEAGEEVRDEVDDATTR